MRIWKFVLEPDDNGVCVVSMPRNRTHLAVGQQHDSLVLWSSVDPASATENRRFAIVGTGWVMPEGYYRGTVQMSNGLVWHIVELQEQP